MTKTNNIPKDWKWVKLEDIAKWGSGGTPTSTNPNYYNGEIPWLIIGDLNDGYISSSEKKITELGLKNSSAKLIKPDSVLIAMYGSIGKLGINKIPVTTNQAIAFTEVIYDNTYNKYLFHYLLHIRSKLHSLGKGGTQKNISQTVLKKVDFPLPPLTTQQAIVSKIEELFSELDNGIAQLKTAQLQLKTYRQSVLKWAFEGKLTEEWRLVGMAGIEPTTSKNKKSRKSINPTNHGLDNKLNAEREGFAPPDLPEGWIRIKLGEVANAIDPQPSHRTPPIEQNGIPFVSIKDFDSEMDKIDFTHARKVSKNVLKEHQDRYTLKLGDFVIGKIGTIGKPVRIVLPQNYCLSANIVLIQPRKINATYLYYFFQSSLIEKAFTAGMKATTQAAFGIQKVRELKVELPTEKEQHQIVQEIESRLSVADKMEESISASLQQAEALRQSILKRAFEGRLI